MEERYLILKDRIAKLYEDHTDTISVTAEEAGFDHLTDKKMRAEFKEEIEQAHEEAIADQEEMYNIIKAWLDGDIELHERLYNEWGQYCDQQLLNKFDLLMDEIKS